MTQRITTGSEDSEDSEAFHSKSPSFLTWQKSDLPDAEDLPLGLPMISSSLRVREGNGSILGTLQHGYNMIKNQKPVRSQRNI